MKLLAAGACGEHKLPLACDRIDRVRRKTKTHRYLPKHTTITGFL